MSDVEIAHQELLMQVAEKLSRIPSTTDHLMLTNWRVLSMCQYLLGCPERELEDACQAALQAFVAHGPGTACDKALKAAGGIIKRVEGTTGTVLPSISKEKRLAVSRHLSLLAEDGPTTIERALRVLAAVRERVSATVHVVSLPGIRHRFEKVAAVLEDTSRPERERAHAAAGVLYVDDVRDVVADRLGVIGMVDDDYALRVVLSGCGDPSSSTLHWSDLHWSEKISSLWDDLPFLQGMNLHRGDSPISVSAARLLLERGVRLQAILVEGYERLYRGRHELPFLINRQGAPPIISWAAKGYYPPAPPTWLPPQDAKSFRKRRQVVLPVLGKMLRRTDSLKVRIDGIDDRDFSGCCRRDACLYSNTGCCVPER